MKISKDVTMVLAFKVTFLKAMLPVMVKEDADFITEFCVKINNSQGLISPEDILKVEELYGKFERKP